MRKQRKKAQFNSCECTHANIHIRWLTRTQTHILVFRLPKEVFVILRTTIQPRLAESSIILLCVWEPSRRLLAHRWGSVAVIHGTVIELCSLSLLVLRTALSAPSGKWIGGGTASCPYQNHKSNNHFQLICYLAPDRIGEQGWQIIAEGDIKMSVDRLSVTYGRRSISELHLTGEWIM